MVSGHPNSWNTSPSGSALARIQKGTEVYLKVTSLNPGFTLGDDSWYINNFSGHLISK